MARLCVCILVLASTAGTARAQHARYPRVQPAPPPLELSDRTLPPLPAPQQPTPVATPAVPTLDHVLSIDTPNTQVRPEQEQILAELINNTSDSDRDEQADYYFRLAELYAKQHRHWLREAGVAREQHLQANAADRAKQYLLKAVKTYKALVDNERFRDYPNLGLALLHYGYTLQSGKYMKEARAVYDKLLKNHPTSKHVPEAHLAFAEYFLDAGQPADAEARYKLVLKFSKSAVYWYAMFKLGTIHVQLQRHQDALETLFQVAQGTRQDAKQEALRHAAIDAFVRAYAEVGKPDKAHQAFTRVDAALATTMTRTLAELYAAQGKHDKRAEVARALAKAPSPAQACRPRYQAALVEGPQQVTELDALARVIAAPEVRTADAACHAHARALIAELAVSHHIAWTRTRAGESLVRAQQLYAAYLAIAPDDETRRAAHAEVLWALADRETNARARAVRWVRAAEAFEALDTPEAARATVLARMNALDLALPASAKVALARPPRSRPRPAPLSSGTAQLIAALEAHLAHGPAADGELAQMRLAAALALRNDRCHEDAVGVLDNLLEHHGDDPRAELAANLMIDSMIRARMLDELREVAAAIAADTAFIADKRELIDSLRHVRKLR
jgi:TolA-binding protein